MTRGFTLFELVVILAILSLLLSAASPSLTTTNAHKQMQNFAHEMSGFMSQARTEAIWRHQDLWAHIERTSSTDWQLNLTDSSRADVGEVVLSFPAERYRQLVLSWSYSADKIKFSGSRGRIKSGSLVFFISHQPNSKLKLTTSFGGNRVMVCGVSGSYYGFPECG